MGYHGSGAAATDETALARRLARRWGVPLTVVDVEPDLANDLEAIVYALDEPHADDSALPSWRLSRAVADGYKVALTGIGGDELFGGYRRHAGLVAGERYGRLPRRAHLKRRARCLGRAGREASGDQGAVEEPGQPVSRIWTAAGAEIGHVEFVGAGQVAGTIGTTAVPTGVANPPFVLMPVNLKARSVFGMGLSLRY